MSQKKLSFLFSQILLFIDKETVMKVRFYIISNHTICVKHVNDLTNFAV